MSLEILVDGKKSPTENAAAMMENFPPTLSRERGVNEFPELPDRIRFASTNKLLQKRIYQDCVSLWSNVDFSKVSYKEKRRLTDDMLARVFLFASMLRPSREV